MPRDAPDPPIQNPVRGTSIDTSAQSLGLSRPPEDSNANGTRTSIPDILKPNTVMKRVEQTAAKLGSSVLGTNSSPKCDCPASQQPSGNRLSRSLSNAGPRRFLSLNRKGKGKAGDENLDEKSRSASRPSLMSRSTSNLRNISPGTEDSPFIRPPSPPPPPLPQASQAPPERLSIEALRMVGSMRAGTQALIQAIQAMPWAEEPENDDDAIPPASMNSDSSDEDQSTPPLASSIHTIHRPIARSRKYDVPVAVGTVKGKARDKDHIAPIPSSEEEDGDTSDEDDDFEATPVAPRFPSPTDDNALRNEDLSPNPGSSSEVQVRNRAVQPRREMTRTSSLATVRVKRRTMLAGKLKDVFGLNDINEVVAELPCWLLRSILLQGYMYLTNSHLCFFAHLPSREDQVLKSGSLNKKTQRTKRWVKHWFVLKNDVLSWYQSSSDPYFPHGVIDLRYAMSCEPTGEKGFRIRTNQKIVNILADSVPSREEWVKAIRKVIFKAQNVGESVKIAIPYSVIVDVDRSTAMDFSETIEVKVVDREESPSGDVHDSYFFAYFHNMSHALDQIRDTVKTYKPSLLTTLGVSEVVHDTTYVAASAEKAAPTGTEQSNKGTYGLKLTSLLRPFQFDLGSAESTPTQNNFQSRSQTPIAVQQSGFVAASPSDLSNQSVRSGASGHSTPTASVDFTALQSQSGTVVRTVTKSSNSHTYPPPPSPPSELASVPSRDSSISVSSWGMPAWLKNSSRRIFASSSTTSVGQKGVSEVLSGAYPSSGFGDQANDFGFSVLETRNAAEPEVVEKFRTTFAFDGREQLLGYFSGYLFRLLPTYGRLYVSTNFFCFKSSGALASRTRMQLPIRDILALEKTKAYRFGHVGLVVIIKGHEELFFEFSSADRRAAFISLLDRQMEEVQRRIMSGEVQNAINANRSALLLDELQPSSLFGDDDVKLPSDSATEDLPAVMFTSTSSTFLTFKPRQPLHFTCLTIGSRGDVQPYISLAKGLMADGHKVRIATHGEFKDWIESHGIEFGYVGGDPAELMRICVENGMFTVSFLKEGVTKFRGWLDDLLKTSWEACQGTDVLIESPSAMAGIHIAEALRIPYFRAFTMTWTRTRAYPHAFAVPEHKMGGSYNYMSYVMFDQVFWRATAGQINRWRRETLRMPSTNLDKLEQHKVPFLYNFSPTVVPPPLDWPEWIRITGYWFLDDADVSAAKWSPPKDLVEFIDKAHQSGKKVVYIGFGSIVVSDPDAMTRCVVDAIVRSGVYAILSKGWSDRLQVKKGTDASDPEMPLPPQIYSIKSIPHDWLFKRIEAACHHGGAGTTGASLRAGIPTIIKPFFGDQYFWGDRVEALGIGSCVRKLTVEGLADALITATTDEKQIAKAKLVGESIRSENGVATAVESIYRDLEYARSLIKSPRTGNEAEENETIRDNAGRKSASVSTTFSPQSSFHSYADTHEGQSEDWSVISDSDEKRSSHHSSDKRVQPPSSKRSSLAAAVLSVLPDALQPSPPKVNSRG